MNYGGPLLGLMAVKDKYKRYMPGRLVGKTIDKNNMTGFVLTLQTREQHIRRERATSNICTSEALMGLMVTVYLATLGKQGLRQVANLCYQKAHYAASLISQIPGYTLPLQGTFFQEFVVQCPLPPAEVNSRLLEQGILGGLDVSEYIPNGMLVCVTEMNSRQEIEAMAAAMAQAV